MKMKRQISLKPKPLRAALSMLLTALISTLNVASAQEAQRPYNDPLIQMSKEDARIFDNALKTLAAQAHVAIVAEGIPLKPAVTDEELRNFPATKARLSVVMEEVAKVYDYSVERRGNIFLLRKRYSDPNDLPDVTIGECLQAVQDVLRVLSPFSPHLQQSFSNDPEIKRFILSLSPEQLEAMRHRALPVASLSPWQRQQVRRVAISFYVQFPEDDIKETLAQMNGVENKETWFGWSEQYGPRLFGYEAPVRGKRRFRPLNNPGQVQSDARGGVVVLSRPLPLRKPDGTLAERPYDDPTDPLPAQHKAAKESTLGSTIGEVVAALAAREGDPARMVVDAALATKSVTVVGSETAPPAQVLKALAEVYGLRIKEEKDGSLRVTRRLWQAVTNIAKLPEAVRRVFPEPLLRALHGNKLDEIRAQDRMEARQYQERLAARKAAEAAGRPLTRQQEQAQLDQWQSQLKNREERARLQKELEASAATLRTAAVRQLRTGVEPKLKATPDGRVFQEALDTRDRQALANLLMADCWHAMRNLLSHEPPDYITHFDRTILTGGVAMDDKGKPKFSLFFEQPPLPDGSRFFRGAGFSNVDYVK